MKSYLYHISKSREQDYAFAKAYFPEKDLPIRWLLLLCFALLGSTLSTFAQTDAIAYHSFQGKPGMDQQLESLYKETQAMSDTATKNTFFKKLKSFFYVNMLVANADVVTRIDSFTHTTFINAYTTGTLEGTDWLTRKLNAIAVAQNEFKNNPYVLFNIQYTAVGENFQLTLTMEKSTAIPDAIAANASKEFARITGRVFTAEQKPTAELEVKALILAALGILETSLGNSLAPTVAIRALNKLYTSGNTIQVWQGTDQHLFLEAVDKEGRLIKAPYTTWTGASAFGDQAMYPIDIVGKGKVTLRMQDAANGKDETVLVNIDVTAASSREQLMAGLDSLIMEVLDELIRQNKQKLDSAEALSAEEERVLNERADKITEMRNQAQVGEAGSSEVETVMSMSLGESNFEDAAPQALLQQSDYGEYIRRKENVLKLLQTLKFLYANKDIIIALLKPEAIPTLITEIENDAGSLAAGITAQLIRGDKGGVKTYLTAYLITKITQMAQQKIANN